MSYNLLEADLQFDLRPLNAKNVSLWKYMMQYIKCRFVGSRIANTKTEMAYDLLEADFHFDLQPLNAKYVSLESTWCSISKYMFLV